MTSKLLPAVAALVVATILQTGLAPYIAIAGVVPNFLLLVVVTLALTTGPNEGAVVGFVAGLAFDLLSTMALGPMALVLTLTGYLAGLLHEQMFAEGWLLPLTVLAAASLLSEVAYALMLDMLGTDVPFWTGVLTKSLPAAVYNTALALLLYPWLARFLRRDQPIRTFRRLG